MEVVGPGQVVPPEVALVSSDVTRCPGTVGDVTGNLPAP
jgi:hypothetical protein